MVSVTFSVSIISVYNFVGFKDRCQEHVYMYGLVLQVSSVLSSIQFLPEVNPVSK